MTQETDQEKQVSFGNFNKTPQDTQRKKRRLWGFLADILISDANAITRSMSLDVDNRQLGIALWFGTDQPNEISFICYIDTCTAVNTGNLTAHKWLITQNPYLVAEYIQFDD